MTGGQEKRLHPVDYRPFHAECLGQDFKANSKCWVQDRGENKGARPEKPNIAERPSPQSGIIGLSLGAQHSDFGLRPRSADTSRGNFFLCLRRKQLLSAVTASVPDFGQEVAVAIAMEDQLGAFGRIALRAVYRKEQLVVGNLGIVDTKDPRSHRPYHVTSRLHLVSPNYKSVGDVDDYVSNGALCHGSRGRQQRHRDYSNSKHLCFHTILPRRFEPQVVSCPRGVGDGLLRPLTAQAG